MYDDNLANGQELDGNREITNEVGLVLYGPANWDYFYLWILRMFAKCPSEE